MSQPGKRIMFNKIAVICLVTAGVLQAEDAPREIPAAIVTTGGTRLVGVLVNDRAMILKDPNGTRQPLDTGKIRRIVFGERIDPNQENQALLALDDLRSEQFELREKAQVKLRSLGRAALRPLRKAAASGDAEEASRARKLLVEMGVRDSDDAGGDRVSQTDGSTLNGEVASSAFAFRSRWGVLNIPLPLLESMEFLKPDEVKTGFLAPAEKTPVALKAKAPPDQANQAERWEAPYGLPAYTTGLAWEGFRRLTMHVRPAPNAQQSDDPRAAKVAAIKEGDSLNDAYSAWGVLMRPPDAAAVIGAVEREYFGEKRLMARAIASEVEIGFIQAGSYDPATKTGREGGVSIAGVAVKLMPQGSLGLAAYDRSGRQIAEVFNSGKAAEMVNANGLPVQNELLAIHSSVPIVRMRLFKTGSNREEVLEFADVVYDRVVDAMRGRGQACVWLASGDRLVGTFNIGSGAEQSVKMKLEVLDENAPAVDLALDEIQRIEPAQVQAAVSKRTVVGTPHGVLLQSGETFRAFLLKLDEKEVVFLFPGGAELKLPRATLRKIDLHPAATEAGAAPAPTEVAADEKPGVDFINRKKQDDPKADPPDAKKTDVLQTTQAMKAMQNAEVVSLDMEAKELTIKDADGDWTISPALARTLVFAENPAAKKAQVKFRDWLLTLRDGSRFEISLVSLTPESATAEMVGGTAVLPVSVIESIERKKQKK